MGSVYLTSDLHLGHKNIAKFRNLQSEEENYEMLKENWHKIITKRDTVFLLGDVCFTEERLKDFSSWRAEQKILILGNHDTDKVSMKTIVETYDKVFSLLKYKEFWLSHAPIHPDELRGRVNIHGHCVDCETEILTLSGWKKYNEVVIGEQVYSVNERGLWEVDTALSMTLRTDYDGDAYRFKTKGLDMLVSDQHRVLFLNTNKKITYETADIAFRRRHLRVLKSVLPSSKTAIDLSDDMIRLYILLAADGNITKSNLCRVAVEKERKKNYVRTLLQRMGVDFNEYARESGAISFNFKLPRELNEWNIKGLDRKLLNANRKQTKIVKDTYAVTDGNRNLIFTSKQEEVDILQTLFVLNGFSCKVHQREGHGFSKNISYQLSVTDKQIQLVANAQKQTEKIHYQGIMWCVTTKNGNFIARRNGSVYVTGNCHYHLIDDHRYVNVCVEQTAFLPTNIEIVRKYIRERNIQK